MSDLLPQLATAEQFRTTADPTCLWCGSLGPPPPTPHPSLKWVVAFFIRVCCHTDDSWASFQQQIIEKHLVCFILVILFLLLLLLYLSFLKVFLMCKGFELQLWLQSQSQSIKGCGIFFHTNVSGSLSYGNKEMAEQLLSTEALRVSLSNVFTQQLHRLRSPTAASSQNWPFWQFFLQNELLLQLLRPFYLIIYFFKAHTLAKQ